MKVISLVSAVLSLLFTVSCKTVDLKKYGSGKHFSLPLFSYDSDSNKFTSGYELGGQKMHIVIEKAYITSNSIIVYGKVYDWTMEPLKYYDAYTVNTVGENAIIVEKIISKSGSEKFKIKYDKPLDVFFVHPGLYVAKIESNNLINWVGR